jgi:hypothetical protein
MHGITLGPLVAGMLFAASDDCYLVTNDRIDHIACDFRASVTDALRYAAADTPEARARRARERQLAVARTQRAPPPHAFRRARVRD